MNKNKLLKLFKSILPEIGLNRGTHFQKDWALLAQLVQVVGRLLLALHGLVKSSHHSGLFFLHCLRHGHHIIGGTMLLLDSVIVMVLGSLEMSDAIVLRNCLWALLHLLHLPVILVLLLECILSRLGNHRINFDLFTFDLLLCIVSLQVDIALVLWDQELLSNSMLIERVAINIFLLFKLLFMLVYSRKFLGFNLVHLFYKLLFLHRVSYSFIGLFFFFPKLNNSCLYFNLLLLGNLILIHCFNHIVSLVRTIHRTNCRQTLLQLLPALLWPSILRSVLLSLTWAHVVVRHSLIILICIHFQLGSWLLSRLVKLLLCWLNITVIWWSSFRFFVNLAVW